ncbi:hypothetical protein BC936DRAFT_145240 [Jimgerdemannia flammicorona]|uniref:Uncharacterized protein n=1 Tax=Jimgerdemannia flammicorona TaxID=994334 RepID=A0A433DLV2_9FUNG|nr:hypothetical protein BC936DRAFT_145240 [Jimgerdemannia flammicorona]
MCCGGQNCRSNSDGQAVRAGTGFVAEAAITIGVAMLIGTYSCSCISRTAKGFLETSAAVGKDWWRRTGC